MKTYKIHLIRHGVTDANRKGIYCGSGTDIPLSAEGREELVALSEEANYPYVDVVYTSPLLRARETAEILFPGCDVHAVDSITEAAFGRFEGKSLEELQHDEEFCRWAAPASNYVPDGVEPAEAFYTRVVTGFVDIVTELMGTGARSAAIVTHADVIATVMAALAYPKGEPYDWHADPGCGFTVLADPTLFLRQPVVEAVSRVPLNYEQEDELYASDYGDE